MAAHTLLALLRGINVGGRNKLPMADLRGLAVDLGFSKPRTYIQSGNLWFGTHLPAPAAGERLSQGILARFGLQVPVVLRTRDQLATARAASPFGHAPDPKFVHIGFFSPAPDPAKVAALDPQRSPPTEFVVIGAEAHVHYVGGSARSKVTMPWFDRQLGVVSTARNLRTVDKLLAMQPACAPLRG